MLKMALYWFCSWKKGGGLISEGVLYAGFYGKSSTNKFSKQTKQDLCLFCTFWNVLFSAWSTENIEYNHRTHRLFKIHSAFIQRWVTVCVCVLVCTTCVCVCACMRVYLFVCICLSLVSVSVSVHWETNQIFRIVNRWKYSFVLWIVAAYLVCVVMGTAGFHKNFRVARRFLRCDADKEKQKQQKSLEQSIHFDPNLLVAPFTTSSNWFESWCFVHLTSVFACAMRFQPG